MKTQLKNFAGQHMSKEQMKRVKGAKGCYDQWYACMDVCAWASHSGSEYQSCLGDCWAQATGAGCDEV